MRTHACLLHRHCPCWATCTPHSSKSWMVRSLYHTQLRETASPGLGLDFGNSLGTTVADQLERLLLVHTSTCATFKVSDLLEVQSASLCTTSGFLSEPGPDLVLCLCRDPTGAAIPLPDQEQVRAHGERYRSRRNGGVHCQSSRAWRDCGGG